MEALADIIGLRILKRRAGVLEVLQIQIRHMFVRLVVVAPIAVILIPDQGPQGAAYAVLAGTAAVLAADYVLCAWRLDISPRRFLAAVWRPVLAAIMMTAAVETAGLWLGQGTSIMQHVSRMPRIGPSAEPWMC